ISGAEPPASRSSPIGSIAYPPEAAEQRPCRAGRPATTVSKSTNCSYGCAGSRDFETPDSRSARFQVAGDERAGGPAARAHLKTVFDDGIVVVRQARVNDQIGDGGEAAEPTVLA